MISEIASFCLTCGHKKCVCSDWSITSDNTRPIWDREDLERRYRSYLIESERRRQMILEKARRFNAEAETGDA